MSPPDPSDIPYVNVVKRLTNVDDIRDVPVIGGLYGTANSVVDYFESDCHPDWHVYVETLFPALGQAVLVLLSFGLDDVLRGYFRPAGGRGFGGLSRASRRYRSPSKLQRSRGILKGGIPELGELTGRRLPGAQIVQARRVGTAEKFLWKVDGLAQRGLWYWMIADVLDDFTVNWTSALMRSQDCIGVEVGGVVRTDVSGVGLIGNQLFGTLTVGHVEESWGPVSHTNRAFSAPEGLMGNLVFSGWWENELPDSGPTHLIVRDDDNAGLFYTSEKGPMVGEGGHKWDVVTVPTVGGHTYTIGGYLDHGWVTWRDLEVTFLVRGGGT